MDNARLSLINLLLLLSYTTYQICTIIVFMLKIFFSPFTLVFYNVAKIQVPSIPMILVPYPVNSLLINQFHNPGLMLKSI